MRILLPVKAPGHGAQLMVLYALLCISSLAVLWSVTEGLKGSYQEVAPVVSKAVFWRQVVWILLGWTALLTAARLPLNLLEESAPLIFLISVAVLVLVLVAAPEVAGSRRWFSLGPVRLQPSEPAKVALILMLARLLGRSAPNERRLLPLAASGLLMMVPLALVLKEPDLGTSLVFAAIWLGMVFWFGLSWVVLLSAASPLLSAVISFYSERILVGQPWPWAVYLLVLLVALTVARFRLLESFLLLLANIASGIGTSVFWAGLKTYQQARILSFFQPEQYPQGAGYQAIQSKIAIGSGGVFGTQYLQGTQKGLAFLPERHTDFIFSVVGEELGLVGAAALLAIFLTLILKGVSVATTARKPFSSLLAIGAVSYFTFHVVVNISITTGLMPVTGLPLPFMSYGGSNFLVSSFLLGLLINVGSRSFES